MSHTHHLTSAWHFCHPALRPSPTHSQLTLLCSGPLSELHYPIDSLTKKPKGFAFITFMFPEHAVKAYAEVDGQVFQVRWLEGWMGSRWAQVNRRERESVCVCVCMCVCTLDLRTQQWLSGCHLACASRR
jgi:hypothetical protein